jgi:Domain of unknown function (DUF4129)
MLAELVTNLGVLLLRLQPPEPEHSPAEAREAADEVMSRPEYQEPPETLMERIMDWIGERFADAASALTLGGVLPTFIAWAILVGIIAGVSFLLVRSIQAGSWGRSGRRGARERAEVITSAEEHRSAKDWLAEAVRHEAGGRWREGLLCRYRSLIVELVGREVLAEVVGRTAGEYVQDVRSRWPDAAGPFVAATDLFEAAWYGGRETGPAERDQFQGLAERTLATLRADLVRSGGGSVGSGGLDPGYARPDAASSHSPSGPSGPSSPGGTPPPEERP